MLKVKPDYLMQVEHTFQDYLRFKFPSLVKDVIIDTEKKIKKGKKGLTSGELKNMSAGLSKLVGIFNKKK